MNYLMSELIVFNVDDRFLGGLETTNIYFRAVVWAGAEFFLWTALAVNWIPRTSLSMLLQKIRF